MYAPQCPDFSNLHARFGKTVGSRVKCADFAVKVGNSAHRHAVASFAREIELIVRVLPHSSSIVECNEERVGVPVEELVSNSTIFLRIGLTVFPLRESLGVKLIQPRNPKL